MPENLKTGPGAPVTSWASRPGRWLLVGVILDAAAFAGVRLATRALIPKPSLAPFEAAFLPWFAIATLVAWLHSSLLPRIVLKPVRASAPVIEFIGAICAVAAGIVGGVIVALVEFVTFFYLAVLDRDVMWSQNTLIGVALFAFPSFCGGVVAGGAGLAMIGVPPGVRVRRAVLGGGWAAMALSPFVAGWAAVTLAPSVMGHGRVMMYADGGWWPWCCFLAAIVPLLVVSKPDL